MLPPQEARLHAWLMATGAACVVVGCTLDPLGTMATPGAGAGGGSATTSGGAGGTETTSTSVGTGGMDSTTSAGGSVGEGGAGGAVEPPILTTCAGLLALNPTPPTGTYEIDPDGRGGDAPFSVWCEMAMAMDGGGWTLVARETAGNTETLRYLGAENGAPDDLLQGQSAIIGARFQGRYTDVRIEWSTDQYIQFNMNGAEMFDNIAAVSLPVANLMTSNANLQGWVAGAGGAKLCRAAVSPNDRPGDTSWAIKPVNDNHATCGCNDMAWVGRGAYYGGTGDGPPDCTGVCDCSAGSFVGVKDNGEAKSGATPYATRIYVR